MTGPWFQTSHQNPQNTAKRHKISHQTSNHPTTLLNFVGNQPSSTINQHFHGPTQPTVANPPSEIFRTARVPSLSVTSPTQSSLGRIVD